MYQNMVKYGLIIRYENMAGFRPGPDMLSGATLLFMVTSLCQLLHYSAVCEKTISYLGLLYAGHNVCHYFI